MPFRIQESGYGVAAVENQQDTIEDISACVELSIRTPRGFRPEAPEFGVTDQTFASPRVDIGQLTSEIVKDEPRAELVSEIVPDPDVLIQRVLLKVGGSRVSGGTDV